MQNVGIFDSFWPGIHLPKTEWSYILANLTSNMTYLTCDTQAMKCHFIGECKFRITDFYQFAFNFIDDRAYQVSPIQYLIDTKDSQGHNMCELGIYGSNTTEFILGDVFMQSLYVMLDYDNSKFALNGNWVPKSQMDTTRYTVPSDEIGGKTVVWIIVGSVLAVLIVVAVIGWFIVRRKNRNLEKNLDNLSKYETL